MAAPLSRIDRSIVLVGMMGVGKSTVGKRLAKRLGLPFVDSDEEIERAADCSVADMFDRFGEASFRDGERRVLARLIEGPPKIIATGGGAFINDETRALVLDQCIAIWLDAELRILAERVSRRGDRPLLRGKDALTTLTSLAGIRNPIYAKAHIYVRSQSSPHERTVDEIIRAIAKFTSG